jgi:hypothetical protein
LAEHSISRAATRLLPHRASASIHECRGDYDLLAGRDPLAANEFVVNDELFRILGARFGDTLSIATGYDPQTREYSGMKKLVLVGRIRFLYGAKNQRGVAMQLPTLQQMSTADRRDASSLFMIRVRDGREHGFGNPLDQGTNLDGQCDFDGIGARSG